MSAQQLSELRKQMAARYKKTPESEKPHIRTCADCGIPIYDRKVCAATGLLHEREGKLIGGQRFDSDHKQITGKELLSAIDALRVKWQPARCTKVRIDVDSINIFQSFVLSRQWKLMRVGFMYGTVDDDGGITVHSIYEPEQQGGEDTWRLLPDSRERNVDRMAEVLGLQRVGAVVTHQMRDPERLVLTAQELLLAAKEQSRWGGHCALVTIGPNMETKQITAQAWQASEQCIRLFQMGFLYAGESTLEEDLCYIRSREPLEVAQEDVDGKGHKKCIIKEPATTVDTRWMTGFVPVETAKSDVLSNTFVRISRPGEEPPNWSNLRNYFHDPKRNRLPFADKIADFHVLIFLMEMLLGPNDIPTVAGAVLARDGATLKQYEDLVSQAFQTLRN